MPGPHVAAHVRREAVHRDDGRDGALVLKPADLRIHGGVIGPVKGGRPRRGLILVDVPVAGHDDAPSDIAQIDVGSSSGRFGSMTSRE